MPPLRDHSKPYGLTFYKTGFKTCVYAYTFPVFLVSSVLSGEPGHCFNFTMLVFLFMEPVQSIIDTVWSSAAISDCEVTITGAMQGQIVFAEGESNSMSVNLGALANLSWKDSAVREQLSKAAEQRKGYNFSVFET